MKHQRNQQGIAMILVMLALGMLAVTTLGITYMSRFSMTTTRHNQDSERAFFTAQSGLNLKVAEVQTDDLNDLSQTMPNSEARCDVVVFEAPEPVPELGGFAVPADHCYVLSTGISEPVDGKTVKMGMLLRKAATPFTAAILAGNKLNLEGNSYTDGWDSATGMLGSHNLAHIGVFSPTGTVDVNSGSFVGYDGSTPLADVVVPTGFTGSVVGNVGTDFANQRVDPLLVAPDPFPVRSYTSSAKIDTISDDTITPTNTGTEYVLDYEEIKINPGHTLNLDVTGLPDGAVVYVDVKEFNMDGGTFKVLDNDDYSLPTSSKVSVQVYAKVKFDAVNNGVFTNHNNEPKRLVAYSEQTMRLDLASQAYMVARAKTNVEVLNYSEIFGSVIGENEVKLQGNARVHYDQALATSGGATTGSATYTFVSYQRF